MQDIRYNNSPAHQRIQVCPHLREILEIITLLLPRRFRAAHTYARY
jgi:hypothetical protein